MTNIRSMILNEKVNKFNDFDRKVKISFDKNQINNCFYSGSNLYSPKNLNKSNLNFDYKNFNLSSEANIIKSDNSKMKSSLEKITTNYLKTNLNSSSQKNNNDKFNEFFYNLNNKNKNKFLNKVEEKAYFDADLTDRLTINNSSVKGANGFLENKKLMTLLNENPEIKDKLNFMKNNSSKSINYNIENFGLLNNNNKKNKNLNFNCNKDESSNNRKSINNLNAIKTQLDNLFEKTTKPDKGYNDNLENLSVLINNKHYIRSNNNHNQAAHQNNKSVKLIDEINQMSHFRPKSANRPQIIPSSPMANGGNLNSHFSGFSPNNNSAMKSNNFKPSNILNTSLNSSNYFSLKNGASMKSNSKNFANSSNYSRMFIPTENMSNLILNTQTDIGSVYLTNYNNDNVNNKFQINNTLFGQERKTVGNSRLNTLGHQDETAEEFSKDLEFPNRKDSLIMKYMKSKKVKLF